MVFNQKQRKRHAAIVVFPAGLDVTNGNVIPDQDGNDGQLTREGC